MALRCRGEDFHRDKALFGEPGMTTNRPRDMAASVRTCLLNYAKERHEEFLSVMPEISLTVFVCRRILLDERILL